MAWEGINRRRFPRANYACVVKVRNKGDSESFKTQTENIGCGGVCVILPKEVKIFSPVEIDLDLNDSRPTVTCDATIVWVIRRSEIKEGVPTVFDIGIEFSNLKNEDKQRIEHIIQECLQKNKS